MKERLEKELADKKKQLEELNKKASEYASVQQQIAQQSLMVKGAMIQLQELLKDENI